jgi:hypothetical protein
MNLFWIMTATGAVWVDRWYSMYSRAWYYTAFHTGSHRTILCGIMDDYGNLVEVANVLRRI